MATGGYYRSDGIQNSGTALRQNWNNAYIYNTSGQIYPRQVVQNVNIINISDPVSYDCQTLRSGYNYSTEKGAWRTDFAYQGFFYGSDGKSGQSCGHFFSSSGKPYVGDNVKSFAVNYVRIEMNRTTAGSYNNNVTGCLRMSNLTSCTKNGVFRGMRWSDLNMNLLNRYSYNFTWNARGTNGGITVLESNDKNSALCQFMTNFLKDGEAQTLCIHNGETSATVHYGRNSWSAGYAASTYFRMTIGIERTVQM